MRIKDLPRGTRRLRTYAELWRYLADFVQGIYLFLWIFGRPGVGKTESIKAALRGQLVYYCKAGQLTPLQFYLDCFHNRGRPIILEDAGHLLDHKVGAKLVSALGDTSRAKLMNYGTTARVLGDVPSSYYTNSPLCILANQVTTYRDILSRALTLFFDPTNLEIHQDVARWYWDQEIHDWFGRHLICLPPIDVRWYLMAAADKSAGRDWQSLLLTTRVRDMASTIIQDLESDPAHPTRDDKARHFAERMGSARGASRASYYRLRKQLEQEGRLLVNTVPPIILRRTRPPATPTLLELDSMGAVLPAEPEEEPQAVDVPSREAFAQPVRGGTPQPTVPPRAGLDDALPWEERAVDDEEVEE